MMIHDCIPCQYGQHDDHIDVPSPAPEGMMGGWECHCKGECRKKAIVRPCPYCEGDGCEECDGTGERHRTSWQTEDGATVSVSGSASLSPEAMKALEAVAEAAFRRMDEESP